MNVLVEKDFCDGDYIIKQGEQGDTFYILLSGCCECTINQPDGVEKVVFMPKQYDYFGERSLLSLEPRAANVTI